MTDYVTFMVAGQLFGLPIEHVQDVFAVASITRVPLASSEIAGILNLRGRIVTVIDLAVRLQLQASGPAIGRLPSELWPAANPSEFWWTVWPKYSA